MRITDEQARTAEAFVAARRSATGLDSYPGAQPQSLESGYAIQQAAIALDGREIVGWKVGRILPPLDAHYGEDRLAGPIFAGSVFTADAAGNRNMPIFAEGFGAAEAEFLLRIGAAPDPDKQRYSLEEAISLIDAVHVGIEIASSPLGAINDLGPAVTISDFGNNNGLVIGAPIANWRESGFEAWAVSLDIDGETAGTGRGETMPDGVFGAARFLLELLAHQGVALKPGTWISSGAVTGVHRVRPGARIQARFGEELTVGCLIGAAAKA